MYTLMMMTALSTSPDATQFNGFFRNLFDRDGSCNGCQGSGTTQNANADRASCQGSCNGSCHGHGLFHGGIIDYFRGGSSCHGSCHGCNGGSCQGSSCQGRSATAAPRSSCQGSCSGGGCTGSVYTGCMGSACFGSLPIGAIPYSMMGGEYGQPYTVPYGSMFDGGAGCLGGGMPYSPYSNIPSPGVPMVPSGVPAPMPQPGLAQPYIAPLETFRMNDSARGTVVVKLPADAKLYAEGRPLSLTSAERRFTTPPLPADRDAMYTFRIEYTRDGEQVTQSKRVTVKAGTTAVLEFVDLHAKATGRTAELFAGPDPKLGTPVAPAAGPLPPLPVIPSTNPVPVPATATVPSVLPPLGSGSAKPLPADRARITVKVPAGATLTVDGRKNERTDATREFTSPALAPGKVYSYVMAVEAGGAKEQRKIDFMAGESHTVDFTAGSRAGR